MAGAFQSSAFQNSAFQTDGGPVAADDIRNFSLRNWRKWRRPDDDRKRERLGLTPEAAEVIADVAARQADDLRRDEQQRIDELRGEMLLRGLEMQSRHLQALNRERERLIDAEIARRIQAVAKARAEDDAALVLILAAAL